MNKRALAQETNPNPETERGMLLLIQVGHAIEQRVDQALEKVGLSGPKFGALTHLAHAGEPMSLGECATRMTCVRSNITQLMDRLEADGFVRRVEDPADRRAVRAAVTPLGLERQAAGAQQIEKVKQELAATLAEIDNGALERMLAAIK